MSTGTIWGREPVLITSAVRAALLAAVGFGLRLEPEAVAGLMVAVEAILAVVVRASVYAPATVAKVGTLPTPSEPIDPTPGV